MAYDVHVTHSVDPRASEPRREQQMSKPKLRTSLKPTARMSSVTRKMTTDLDEP
jgi:hypothetical protein